MFAYALSNALKQKQSALLVAVETTETSSVSRTAYLPNLKYLSPPVTKILKATQNIENGVVCSS